MNQKNSNILLKYQYKKNELEQRLPVWNAISELWVDNELNIDSIAQVLVESGYTKEELNQIFKFEVSPVVWKNFGFFMFPNPIPPVWSGFNSDWLKEKILKNIEKNQNKFYRLYIQNSLCTLLRTYFVKEEWNQILSIFEKSESIQ